MITFSARIAAALTAVALVTSGCGSSSPSPSPAAAATSASTAGSPSAATSPTNAGGSATGGAFCNSLSSSQAAIAGQRAQFAKALVAGNFTSVKSALSDYFHKLAVQLAAVESTMTGAPPNVQAAMLTVNKTYARMLAAVDGAGSLAQMSAGFDTLGKDPQLKPALATLKTYGEGLCGK